MKPTTLSEYYSSQGQALPSVSARQSQAAQAGIQNYSGTAQQNTQLLGYLQNQGSNTATPVIPAQNVGSGTQPVPLPNQPQSQEQSNVYASASSYLANLPKTGVAGLDQISQAMIDIPGQLAQEYDIANKQNLATQTENALNAFNEEYRVKAEQLRVDNTRTAASKQTSIEELERNRAFKAGSLAIEAAFRAKDFQGAKELMNQQAALELEPLKMRYKFFEDMYNRTEDQKFKRQMVAEERAYEEQKALKQAEIDLKMAGAGILSPEKQKQFISDSTAKQAASRVGVINAINEYYKKVEQYKGKGGVLDFNRLTKTEKADLKTALNTTIGSAINVAQGQGAMGNEEAERIMGQLDPSRWTRTKVFESAARGITDSQATLLRSNLDFLETYYPGVKNMTMFSDFMSDDEFFNNASTAPSTVDVTTYFGGVEL